MTVVERNWRCPAGEIDIVALDGETLVLCEVKTRSNGGKGTPEEAVTPAKQRRYARLAQAYLQQAGVEPRDGPLRRHLDCSCSPRTARCCGTTAPRSCVE